MELFNLGFRFDACRKELGKGDGLKGLEMSLIFPSIVIYSMTV